jgi:hypothetical protein
MLVDPHICPDCRAPLDTAGTCTACGLRLRGPDAAALWEHMQQADRLITRLRATAVAEAPVPGPTLPPLAPLAPAAARPARAGLPSSSVPVVLLALGGLCLLVAAVVFVAVAWSSLGLGAKTAILLVVTAAFGAGAAAVTRRDLRFAAETLWLLVAGMVALDLGAAYGADLLGLGRLSDRDAVGLVGATLLGLGVAVGAWATTTPLARLHGPVGVATIGTVLLAGAEAWTNVDHNPLAVAVSVPLLAAAALGIDRATGGHLRPTALVVAAGGLVSWVELAALGVDRMTTTLTDRAWWTELPGWPLLVAAGFATGVAVLRPVPGWARMVAAGGALVTAALFVVGPSTGPTADLLAWAAASVLVSAVAAFAPMIWARPAAAVTALGLLGWSTLVLVRPLDVASQLPTTGPADRLQLDLVLPAVGGGPAPWTAVVAALAVGVTFGGLVRHLFTDAARDAAGRAFIALGPGALALGATTALLETEPRLWVAVLAWSATLALTAAMAVTVSHHSTPLIASLTFVGYLVVADLRLAVPSHLLAALVASGIAVALAVGYARARPERLGGWLLPSLASGVVLMAGFAATHWPYLAGGRGDAAGLCAAAVAAAALVLAHPVRRPGPSRITIEGTALALGVVAAAFPDDLTIVAMVLTVLGSAAAVVAVLNRDREETAWIGVLLLGVATVLRLAEDVRVPEWYTLPAAALLVVAGWWRLRADPSMSSVRALSSGLTLALLPSLLLTLDDPVSVRGTLVAAAGLATLAVGVVRHWAAPFAAGAAVTAILAVWHLGPVVDALPRWISLGTVGLALLLVGVTWERRRRDVEATSRYLTALL